MQSESKKAKVLVCYTELLHYRLDVFSELGKHVDLTVTHSGAKMTQDDRGFREIILPRYKLWRFSIQSGLMAMVRDKKYNAVIFFMDLAWIMTFLGFLLCPRSTRRLTWGLWFTSSGLANKVRLSLAKIAKTNIFYSALACDEFQAAGLSADKCIVARNTYHVANPHRPEPSNRDTFLVVGSFNPRKRNEDTVRAFTTFCEQVDSDIKLIFIGAGHEKAAVEVAAQNSSFADRIIFHPATSDPAVLSDAYASAIASVSFGQAGLSVLQSFAHGVPFVTAYNAISGGEIENIDHMKTGILCEPTQDGLIGAMAELALNRKHADHMGEAALHYYLTSANSRKMVEAFTNAIGMAESDPRAFIHRR